MNIFKTMKMWKDKLNNLSKSGGEISFRGRLHIMPINHNVFYFEYECDHQFYKVNEYPRQLAFAL